MKNPTLWATTVFIASVAGVCLRADGRLVLGANFNEHAEMIRWQLLEESDTRVIRGFIPASPFLRGQRDLATDEAVQNLKRAAADGYKVILCLKWDFKVRDWRVPAPGSAVENQCFSWVDGLLVEVGDVFMLETINEVMIDTQPEDLLPDAAGRIAMVEFQKRLVDHLFAGSEPPPVYMGGFTRLYDEKMQTHPITGVLLDWINGDERITGTNFHIHAREMDWFEDCLKFIKGRVPRKPFIITEFSLVWKYKLAMKHPLGRFDKGREFARLHGLDPDLPVREYVNSAMDRPVPEQVWNEFMRSQYWYEPDFLDKACRIMDQYGVTHAAYAFQQGSSGLGKLGPDSNPWILNPVYVPTTAVGKAGKTAVNKDFMESYHKWN